MGITINQLAQKITFRDLLVQLDIIPEGRKSACRVRRAACRCIAAGR